MELNLKQKIELKKLKDNNICRIEIHYSGGGDDGCIEEYCFYDIENNSIIIKDEVFEELDDYFYSMLCENIEWDWVNNDGGYGILNLNIETNKITIDHTQRVTEQYDYKTEEPELFEIINGTS
tara:strand:- start:184 stop:552 length:369 start_codon:yes stop_codon:yes gene_type:complete